MRIYYKHPIENKVKEVKRGYSWTTLLFGSIPAAIRGDWKWFMISLSTAICLGALLDYMLPAKISTNLVFLGWSVWAGYYNKIYEQELINNGYEEMKN